MRVTIEEAAHLLSNSTPVAIPTETVYGLAAVAKDERGIERIFELKKRPRINPLITHLSKKEELQNYTAIPKEVEILLDTFWPGPLTIVLPIQSGLLPSIVTAGKKSAAFRVPLNATTRTLIQHTAPLVAPSANLSGTPSATTRLHVEQDFGESFPVLENEGEVELVEKQFGLESTILVYEDGRFIVGRLGALPIRALEKALKTTLPLALSSNQPVCPGQLLRHYAPKAMLYLSKNGWEPSQYGTYDCVVGFSDKQYQQAPLLISWGRSDDPTGCGRELYSTLRKLDELGAKKVFWDICGFDQEEWQVIQDRLMKASNQ